MYKHQELDRTHDGWLHDCHACHRKLADRIATGECAIVTDRSAIPWVSWCLTHNVAATIAHHFATHPDASTD